MGFSPSRRAISDSQSLDVEIDEAFDLYPNGKPCFYCSEPLRDAMDDHVVYWAGHHHSTEAHLLIHLHPKCAMELGQHLIKDGMIGDSPTSIGALPPWLDAWPSPGIR